MDTQHKLNPKFFFLSVGVLATLIASFTSFLMLAFETFNKHFPDALNAVYSYGYSTYNYEAIRAALATLIIVFPAFLILSYFWNKASRGELGKIDTIIRKWMIYLILFLAVIVVITDLIVLVRYFVSGEVTNRFIWKVIVALAAGGITGSYYILLAKNKGKKAMHWIYAIIAAILVIASIVWSFCVMGSPASQRKLRFDDRRVSDLQTIQSQVINYWQQKKKLPTTIKDLNDPTSYFTLPVDPEFEKGKMYEYKITGAMKFELCATFSLPMPKGWNEYNGGYSRGGMMEDMMDVAVSYPYPGPGGANDSWDHQTGRTCFSRTIDPQIYPPFEIYR